jgi:hypothetical protein
MKSGFNLLKLKKEEDVTCKRYFKRHLVIGDDLYSLNIVHELLKRGEDEQVAWLSPRSLEVKDLLPGGPSSLRGTSNIEAFEKACPEISLTKVDSPALFYKELKWRPFGGRAKSEPLQWGEEFYTKPRADFDYSDLFSFLKKDNNEQMEKILSKRIDLDLSSVVKTSPDDLAEPAHFVIKASNGDEISCEHLYWGRNPSSFADYYEKLDDLSSTFIEFCESTQTPDSLSIVLSFKGVVTDMTETLFIPLSYTHEWGHFVGEFSTSDNGTQSARFMTFLDENSSSEEDISKKIRLFKRNLEKIFPKISTQIQDEFIKLGDEATCLSVDDQLFIKSESDMTNLHFVSVNAPIEATSSDHPIIADSLIAPVATARALIVNQNLFA